MNVIEEIQKLKLLLDQKGITIDEFKLLKKKIMLGQLVEVVPQVKTISPKVKPPKGKTSKNCSSCGNQLEISVIEIKSKAITTPKSTDEEIILEYIRGGSQGKLELPMADLKGVQLKGVNLIGANFKGANFENADLRGAKLKNANLSNSCLIRTNLSDADLTNANLSTANIELSNFSNTKLSNAIIKNAILTNSIFENADLREVDLSFSHLNCQGFGNSILIGTNFSNTKLFALSVEGSDLSDSNFSKAEFDYSTNFMNSNLSRANFSNVHFIGENPMCVLFSNSDLTNTNFTNSNLSGVFFSSAKLNGTNFKGASLQNSIFFKVDLTHTNLNDANVEGARFKKTKSKKSGCYITTSCCEAMHLPDDCHELQTLRKFRDGFVSMNQSGRELIEEYYRISQPIIDAINATNDGSIIFRSLYSEIEEIVSLIDNNKPQEAYQYYYDMTMRLKKKYLE